MGLNISQESRGCPQTRKHLGCGREPGTSMLLTCWEAQAKSSTWAQPRHQTAAKRGRVCSAGMEGRASHRLGTHSTTEPQCQPYQEHLHPYALEDETRGAAMGGIKGKSSKAGCQHTNSSILLFYNLGSHMCLHLQKKFSCLHKKND